MKKMRLVQIGLAKMPPVEAGGIFSSRWFRGMIPESFQAVLSQTASPSPSFA
jgi:hypothetical protein